MNSCLYKVLYRGSGDACYWPSFTHGSCYCPSFTHGTYHQPFFTQVFPSPSFTYKPLAFIRPSFTHGLLLVIRPSLTHGLWTCSHNYCCQARIAVPAILWIHKYAYISSFHVSVVSHFRHYKSLAYGCMSTSTPIKDLRALCSPHLFCLQHLIRGRLYTYKGLRISRGGRLI